jgi:Neuraminidase (sialidase)
VQVVGDYANGNIYELSASTYTENGTAIRREADSAPVHASGVRSYMSEVFVDLEAGVGLALGQGSDPILMLSWSDDGGRTWSNERHLKIGKIGEYGTQALTTRLGSFRQRSIRIAVSDPINAIITGFYGTIGGSAH